MEHLSAVTEFEQKGFALIGRGVELSVIEGLVSSIEQTERAGIRQPHIAHPVIADFVRSPWIRSIIEPVLGPRANVVRSILFDKTAETNWSVPWHQDLTIAVAERRDVPGFSGWSIKNGIHHTQAPQELLERMATLRFHLDECGSDNGPLRVLPGTHQCGKLDEDTIARLKGERREHICIASRGDALLMRPLLLHASSRAVKPTRRRVLHLEFSGTELPGGLRFVGDGADSAGGR